MHERVHINPPATITLVLPFFLIFATSLSDVSFLGSHGASDSTSIFLTSMGLSIGTKLSSILKTPSYCVYAGGGGGGFFFSTN